jgi:hypothetical protein
VAADLHLDHLAIDHLRQADESLMHGFGTGLAKPGVERHGEALLAIAVQRRWQPPARQASLDASGFHAFCHTWNRSHQKTRTG